MGIDAGSNNVNDKAPVDVNAQGQASMASQSERQPAAFGSGEAGGARRALGKTDKPDSPNL